MYDSYETTLDTLHAFASELSNQLQHGTRFYEGFDMFDIKPIADGMHSYSVTSYDVEQPISVYNGGSIPEIVKKYIPEEPDDYEEWWNEAEHDWRDVAFIGFHVTPYEADTVCVIPYVDYRHIDSRSYAEGSPKFLTIEQITKEPARYVGTLELMLAQL